MVQTRGSISKLSALKDREREKDRKILSRITEKKEGHKMPPPSSNTADVVGSRKRGLTITLPPCKGKPMSGMHTAIIQDKSKEQEPPTHFTPEEGEISLFTREIIQEELFFLSQSIAHTQ